VANLRFATARDVFEAFPTAREDITTPPAEVEPTAFVKTLATGETPEDAIGFCAYMLPRREAVWWACQCLRTLDPSPPAEEAAAIEVAETWVREPEEHRRRAALRLTNAADQRAPATWAAFAAAWSGGSMVEGEHPVPAPPHLTAKAVRAAVLIALARVGAKERERHLRACIDGALSLVRDETPARSAG
jgi:hypothetical protein